MEILFEIAAIFEPVLDFFMSAIFYIGAIILVMVFLEKCRAHFVSKKITLKKRRQYH